MSIRLDPRRLAALKLLAAEAGVRPGEMVTHWVEERLDAARRGEAATAPATDGKAMAALSARVDELARRLDALVPQATPAPAAPPSGAPAFTTPAGEAAPSEGTAPAPKRRGRPPKATTGGSTAAPARRSRAKAGATPRIPLHEEITAIIKERGPMSAVQLAAAITERGRYSAPRSTKPLDAATVSARVSNPVYRSRFVRRQGLISLADPEAGSA
jgi:chemotaxis protein histidine kinase CheA